MSQQNAGSTPRRALPPDAPDPNDYYAAFDDAELGEPTRRLQLPEVSTRVADTPQPSAPTRRFRGTLLRTTLGTLLPGAGLLGTRAEAVGIALLSLCVLSTAGAGYVVVTRPQRLLGLAVNPRVLQMAGVGIGVLAVLWILLVLGTYLITRPRQMTGLQRVLGAITVSVMSVLLSVPLAVGASYAYESASFVNGVFSNTNDTKSQTRATLNPVNPWASKPRLNILLLGGDNGAGRDLNLGIRTDTIMVASIDTTTGNTVIIQVPRNMSRTPFPSGSPLAQAYPRGFYDGSNPDDAEYFANAIWDNVPKAHPELFQNTDYPGADAMKLGIGSALGLNIDYFLLVNIDGISQLVDAMGGVTVNVNFPVAKGGHVGGVGGEACGVDGYVPEGPNRHLNGTDAMWYARSRCNDPNQNDYGRMQRQSCLVNAIIGQANPQTMLTRFEGIANSASQMLLTDIPKESLDPIVQLAWKVKDASVSRVVFVHGVDGYYTNDPDFNMMRARVASAIVASSQQPTAASAPASQPAAPPAPTTGAPTTSQPAPSATDTPPPAENVTDACAYRHEEPTQG